MGRHFNRESTQRQRAIAKEAVKVDASHFFNLLTAPELLSVVEAQLPEHRERWYPPTVTLAMFLGQVMSADERKWGHSERKWGHSAMALN